MKLTEMSLRQFNKVFKSTDIYKLNMEAQNTKSKNIVAELIEDNIKWCDTNALPKILLPYEEQLKKYSISKIINAYEKFEIANIINLEVGAVVYNMTFLENPIIDNIYLGYSEEPFDEERNEYFFTTVKGFINGLVNNYTGFTSNAINGVVKQLQHLVDCLKKDNYVSRNMTKEQCYQIEKNFYDTLPEGVRPKRISLYELLVNHNGEYSYTTNTYSDYDFEAEGFHKIVHKIKITYKNKILTYKDNSYVEDNPYEELKHTTRKQYDQWGGEIKIN